MIQSHSHQEDFKQQYLTLWVPVGTRASSLSTFVGLGKQRTDYYWVGGGAMLASGGVDELVCVHVSCVRPPTNSVHTTCNYRT